MTAFCEKVQRFALSEIYSILVFLIAYACVVFEQPAFAFCAMMAILIIVCLFCDDILPMLLPLLLLFCVALLNAQHVAELDWLFYCFVPTAGVALVYRFARGVRTLRLGGSFFGLVAVSGAVLLGGIGSITPGEYFSIPSLYHVLGLGPLMIVLYLFLKSAVNVKRDYDVADKVAGAMYLAAVFIAFMILRIFVAYPDIWEAGESMTNAVVRHAPWRNSAAALVVMMLPFIFYYARRHHPIHLLSALAIYITITLSGSRGAFVCGGIQMVLCLFFFYLTKRSRLRRIILIAVLVLLALVIVFVDPIIDFCSEYLRMSLNFDNIAKESRFRLFFRSFEDFSASPVFGTGLGYMGNQDIYVPYEKTWQITWYHSLIPQIIGSLGIVGVLAYGYQLWLRLRVILAAERTLYTKALLFSYIGILLYSQIDPGIFSPMPFAALTVFLFVFLEARAKNPQSGKV